MKRKLNSIWFFSIIAAIGCNSPKEESNQSNTKSTEIDKTVGQAFVEDEVSNPNVLQIAIKSEDHSTLVAAVQAAVE